MERWIEARKRESRNTALICHTIALGMGLKKADGGAPELEDFMPQPPESEADRIARFEKVMMAMVEHGNDR